MEGPEDDPVPGPDVAKDPEGPGRGPPLLVPFVIVLGRHDDGSRPEGEPGPEPQQCGAQVAHDENECSVKSHGPQSRTRQDHRQGPQDDDEGSPGSGLAGHGPLQGTEGGGRPLNGRRETNQAPGNQATHGTETVRDLLDVEDCPSGLLRRGHRTGASAAVGAAPSGELPAVGVVGRPALGTPGEALMPEGLTADLAHAEFHQVPGRRNAARRGGVVGYRHGTVSAPRYPG